MSFWTGLEAFTGHRPGAFTGMTMKDLFDKDMWDRMPRTWSGQMGTPAHLQANPMDRQLSRGGEPMMTNWARGGGGPEEVISRHRPDVPQPVPYPSMRANYPAMPAQAQTTGLPSRPNLNPTPLSPFIPGVSSNQGPNSIRQWGTQNPNVPGSMAFDPTWAGGLRGARFNAQVTTPPSVDMTTVVKKSANPHEYDTQTTTIKEKLDQAGLSLNRTANERVVPATPPGTTDIFSHGQWMPVNPTKTLMNMDQPGFLGKLGTGIGNQWSNLWDASILRQGTGAWDAMKVQLDEARRKRYEDAMRARRGY